MKTGQDGTVNALYQATVQRAFADETREMVEHLKAKILDNTEAAGFLSNEQLQLHPAPKPEGALSVHIRADVHLDLLWDERDGW